MTKIATSACTTAKSRTNRPLEVALPEPDALAEHPIQRAAAVPAVLVVAYLLTTHRGRPEKAPDKRRHQR